MYNTANMDINAIKQQVHVKKFNPRTPEVVMRWYNKVREAIKQKPSEDTQVKFTMIKLLLEGPGLHTFLQLKTAAT